MNYTSEHIEALAKKAQQGDASAFGELFRLLSQEIYRYVLGKLCDDDKAKDVTSETFHKAWRYIHAYKQDNFRAYIYRIAHNTMMDEFRKKRRTTILSDDYEDESEDISEILESKDELHILTEALAKLPSDYYSVIVHRYFNDLSVRETAEVMGKTEENVRVLQHRAIHKLKMILT